ncbi:unnamed protein product [Schistosoma mattheei]|uniref:Uncharacterized protein n=1 Tax=Schistosoma mattheei TaxID=31246 RepID=A0A183PTA0_9TREM|nr:unnamed protein product [Schistosoma mattheei]
MFFKCGNTTFNLPIPAFTSASNSPCSSKTLTMSYTWKFPPVAGFLYQLRTFRSLVSTTFHDKQCITNWAKMENSDHWIAIHVGTRRSSDSYCLEDPDKNLKSCPVLPVSQCSLRFAHSVIKVILKTISMCNKVHHIYIEHHTHSLNKNPLNNDGWINKQTNSNDGIQSLLNEECLSPVNINKADISPTSRKPVDEEIIKAVQTSRR